jgi:hypothetical protein
MKRIAFLTSFLIIAFFSVVTYFSSCKPDACITRNVICQNNGVCREGDCLCSAGFEGDSCQFKVNKKFDSYYACIRTKLINDTIVDDNDDTLRVKAKSDKFGITFNSIRDSVVEVIDGTVNGNYITIPEKTILTTKYWGNGSLNNGVLTITLYTSWLPDGSAKTTYVGYKY